jgi:DNA-binding HxlR family transcriptional regulator
VGIFVADRNFSCGLDVALAVIGGKWKPLILFHLKGGPKRFAEIKRLVGGISEKVLIQCLREFVSDKVLTRRDFQQVPPKVEYEMTPFGITLAQALGPLCAWGSDNQTIVEEIVWNRDQTNDQRPSQSSVFDLPLHTDSAGTG